MREKLFRIAVFIGIAGLLPLLLIMFRRDAPPPEVHIKKTKQQIIRDFVFSQEKNNQTEWKLKAPEAKFIDNHIILINPILIVNTKNPVTITAKKAIYYKQENRATFEKVKLKGQDFYAEIPKGRFDGKRQIFHSNSNCHVKFLNGYTIEGKNCTINFKTGKVIISKTVKTVIKPSEEK
ncbi:LPS export ABC transporter periplasmic protein LptC [Desulfurobacterium sp.]